jgi:DNA-binding response OmpR family regulator
VLVVEDDRDTRQLLVAALTEGGYDPITALDGRHALRTALATDPTAILLDLMLPEADGAEFVREYREHLQRSAATPIVVVSAKHDAAAVAERIGARACIRKPFEIDHLMERLGAVIRDAAATPRRAPA